MQHQREFKVEPFGCSTGLDVVVLLGFSVLVSFWGLTGGPGLGDHEAIVAQAARQIRLGDDWLIPKVNDVPFVRKPPLGFWLAAVTSIVVDPPEVQPPVSTLAARLPSAICAVITTLLVYLMGRSMFGHRAALLSGAAMTVSIGGMFYSHNAQVEMILTCCCTAAFAFFWFGTRCPEKSSRWMPFFYLSFALAMLAKAPLPLATVGLPLFVWWFLAIPLFGLNDARAAAPGASSLWGRMRAQFGESRRLWLIPGIALLALVFLPWPIYVYMKVDNALDLWRLEFLDRYTGDLSPTVRPFWYYIPFVFLFTFPFSLSVPESVSSPFRKEFGPHRRGLLFALVWATVQIAFLSTSAFKRAHYLIGALPALCLLLGPTLDRMFLSARSFSIVRVRLAVVAILSFFLIGLVTGGVLIGRESSNLMTAYVAVAAIGGIGVTACGIVFVSGQRAMSLLLLQFFTAFAFAWGWQALGQSRTVERQVLAMVKSLREMSIGQDDRITWVGGRPDARLAYYMGQEIQPLFSPLELAPRRDGRRVVPRELLIEGANRITQRLESEGEEYFILDAESWERFRTAFSPPAREVVRVNGDGKRDQDDDWVLITNLWNTGEEEDFANDGVPPTKPSTAAPTGIQFAP